MKFAGTVVILGVNSFSGAVTTKKFLDSGFQVIGLNRSPEVAQPYRAYANSSSVSNLVLHELGSNYDAESIVEICKNYNAKNIINFAAQSMVAQSWDNPWDWYQTNCVWLSRLTSTLIKWGKLERFLHYTTPEVYGSTSGWISENNPLNPSTPYAISRAAGDLHLRAEHSRSHFPVVFTRAANVFGPHQQRYRIIPKALIFAATNRQISLHGGGMSERSFIFMTDVAEALWKVFKSGEIGSCYHISTQRLVSIRRVVEMCFEAYGKDISQYLHGVQDRPGKDQAYMLDSKKLREELSWREEFSLETGIAETKNWVDNWLSELLDQPEEYLHQE